MNVSNFVIHPVVINLVNTIHLQNHSGKISIECILYISYPE